MRVIALTALCVLGIVPESLAWSGLEHKAVAEVAQEQLTNSANAKLAKLLRDGSKLTPGRLAQFSMWPDEIPDDRPWRGITPRMELQRP
jgi:hypothetical protein